MKISGLFVLKTSLEDLIEQVDKIFIKFDLNRIPYYGHSNLIMICNKVVSFLDGCFLEDTIGYKRFKEQILEYKNGRYVNQYKIMEAVSNIFGMLVAIKNMTHFAFCLNTLPTCKKLLEFSVEDAISLSKDLVKNDIVKKEICALLLGKDVSDTITIFHVKNFYENLYSEIVDENYSLSQIEKVLLDKCAQEINYCKLALIKVGLGVESEVKDLNDVKCTDDVVLASF